MTTALERFIAKERAAGYHRNADALGLLLSSSPDAEKIRRWFKRHARPWMGKIYQHIGPDCENWEIELWDLSQQFRYFYPLSAWERASTQERNARAMRVAKLARELAGALEEEPRPYYPIALDLFDPERAVDIIRALESPDAILNLTGYSPGPGTGYARKDPGALELLGGWRNPATELANHFDSKPQELAPMLRRLADRAEAQAKKPKRDNRPNVPDADARVFAREITDFFEQGFGRRPNTIIAACVALKFPQLDPPPDEAVIRKWRGVK